MNSLEHNFDADFTIAWAYQIYPIKSVSATLLREDVYDCFLHTKERLEEILNTIYKEQLSDVSKCVVAIPEMDDPKFEVAPLISAIELHFLE